MVDPQISSDIQVLKTRCAEHLRSRYIDADFAQKIAGILSCLGLSWSAPYGDRWPCPHFIGWRKVGIIPATYGALRRAIDEWEQQQKEAL